MLLTIGIMFDSLSHWDRDISAWAADVGIWKFHSSKSLLQLVLDFEMKNMRLELPVLIGIFG